MGTAVRRTIAVTEMSVPTIAVPKGRSAAERRVAAVAALHQPVLLPVRRILATDPVENRAVCGECKVADEYGRAARAPWPCSTVRLLGPWPGETEEVAR